MVVLTADVFQLFIKILIVLEGLFWTWTSETSKIQSFTCCCNSSHTPNCCGSLVCGSVGSWFPSLIRILRSIWKMACVLVGGEPDLCVFCFHHGVFSCFGCALLSLAFLPGLHDSDTTTAVAIWTKCEGRRWRKQEGDYRQGNQGTKPKLRVELVYLATSSCSCSAHFCGCFECDLDVFRLFFFSASFFYQ